MHPKRGSFARPSASYAKLVAHYLGLQLGKHETRSDWLQRPQSNKQISYACEDVAYLRSIWERQSKPFWQRKTLDEMSREEWESLCDGCGRCCVIKLADEDTGEAFPTSVVCRLFNLDTCRCTRYAERHRLVPDCVRLDSETVREYDWLPGSCAYRRLAEGRGLAWWHPLVSGDAQTVIDAGISVYGNVIPEPAVHPDEPLDQYVVRWVHEP